MIKMTIDISNETIDNLFRDILIQDYKRLCNDIKNTENKLENLEVYEKEDLECWQRWRNAIAVIMEYYIENNIRLEILKDMDE